MGRDSKIYTDPSTTETDEEFMEDELQEVKEARERKKGQNKRFDRNSHYYGGRVDSFDLNDRDYNFSEEDDDGEA